ncbi:MAG: 16S rRNA (cytidine(1402)-2'-O)-methyltransferase, partial [Burkholderiales bacterium]|nr:16S rRNA (cytidine(1402)-2'-O)-methyltransferase [Burkholderiales bacterium]
SVTTLLCAAGIEPVHNDLAATGFAFVGFLPTKTKERERAVQALATDSRAIVILEAPHRIQDMALALSLLGSRQLSVGRELTKQFEDIATVACADFPAWLAASPQRSKGEFALVLHPMPHMAANDAALPTTAQRTLHLLLAELPLKTAVRLAADITQLPKNVLYEAALAWKATQDTDD